MINSDKQDVVKNPSKFPIVKVGLWLLFFGLLSVVAIQLVKSQAGGIRIGEPAPDFSLTTFEDEEITLASLSGKVIVMNFWASWCIECGYEAILKGFFMKRITVVTLLLLNALVIAPLYAVTDNFPGRVKYPEVNVIEKNQLITKMNKVVIIDARSPLEFKTLRIKGAINIPVSSKTFVDKVKELRRTTAKPIVFYCNGRTCMKSYIASKKCIKAKIKNISAYDAGMFEWAKAYPKQAELFGVSPVRKSDIISSANFKKRLLSPEKFGYNVFNKGKKNVILDVRDKFQRGAAGFFPGKEAWISLNNERKLNAFIKQAKKDNKTLYIYDEVGKQVRWLQYALEGADIKNYYFMGKGAKGYYASMMKEMGISTKYLK